MNRICKSFLLFLDDVYLIVDGSDEDRCDLWKEDMAIRSLELASATDTSARMRWWPKPELAKTAAVTLEYKLAYTVYEHGYWRNTTEVAAQLVGLRDE